MMRRNYGSFRNSGAYTSPGTPEHCEQIPNEIVPKTWSSERVPLPGSIGSNRMRPITAAALMPFNATGRTLPSKWDDAERWITSPVSGFGGFRFQPQRRPKSKSGPLGPTGLVYMANYKNFMANSPLTTGVFVPEGLSVHYEAGFAARTNFSFDESSMNRSTSIPGLDELSVHYEAGVPARTNLSFDEGSTNRSTSVPGLNDLICEASVPNSPGEEMTDEGRVAVLCRDVATQMSPDGSERLSFSNFSCAVPADSFSLREKSVEKDEIRDVQVDKGTTTAKKRLNKSVEDLPLAWSIAEASKNTSKVQREESKITAWENLQKAKAEAAIRKLEMKLEKKRSASMDKISNKLRAAQMKAQTMRDLGSEQPPRPRSCKKFPRRVNVKISALFPCFVCRESLY